MCVCVYIFLSAINSDASGNIYTSEIPKKAVYLALRAGGAYISSKCHDDIEKSDLHLVRARESCVCVEGGGQGGGGGRDIL